MPKLNNMKSRRNNARRSKRTPEGSLAHSYGRYLANTSNIQTLAMPADRMTAVGVLTGNGVFTTTSSGTAGLMIPENPLNAPSVYNGFGNAQQTEFASYAAIYDEFRVKAIILEYVPTTTYFTTQHECVVLADYDNEVTAGSLTTTQLAMRYSTAKMINITQESQFVFAPPKIRSFPAWQSTASTAKRGSLYVYLKSSSGGIICGNFVVKYIVTFRVSNG
jgi:hypothetical protein